MIAAGRHPGLGTEARTHTVERRGRPHGRSRPALSAALLCLAALAWLATLAWGCAPTPPATVVLVTLDTVRVDHLSAYGYPAPTSPTLELLAARGVLFTNAFAASSSTAPSHASILTGLYPGFHSVGPYNFGVLEPRFDTLAERLRRLGFRTAAVVSNPVLAADLGLDQGFDDYDDRLESRELNRAKVERYADRAVDLAVAQLGREASRPLFLWLHLQDPHGPYAPPDDAECGRFRRASGQGVTLPAGDDHSGHRAIPAYQLFAGERSLEQYVARYDCEIAFLDRHLGRFLDRLEQKRPGALVVVTADHGEALGEDGFYFAHSHSAAPDQVRIPLLVAGPGIPGGRVVETPVSHAAVFATVLDEVAAGTETGEAVPSLLATIDPAAGEPSPVFVESASQLGIVDQGGYLLRVDRFPPGAPEWAVNPNSGSFWKPLGLEVTALDPAGPPPPSDLVRRLLDRLEAYAERTRSVEPLDRARRRRQTLSEERLEALRALGYVE